MGGQQGPALSHAILLPTRPRGSSFTLKCSTVFQYDAPYFVPDIREVCHDFWGTGIFDPSDISKRGEGAASQRRRSALLPAWIEKSPITIITAQKRWESGAVGRSATTFAVWGAYARVPLR